MQDPISRLMQMKRPRVLIVAARHGTHHYDRRRDLPRAIGRVPGHGAAMMRLFDLEAALDEARHMGDPNYRPVKHVAVLTALMAEAALLRSGAAMRDTGPDL